MNLEAVGFRQVYSNWISIKFCTMPLGVPKELTYGYAILQNIPQVLICALLHIPCYKTTPVMDSSQMGVGGTTVVWAHPWAEKTCVICHLFQLVGWA